MPIDLGGYSWIAKTAIDFGFPILGTALGMPGPVSEFAARKLKEVLNLSPRASAETVQEAITTSDPDTVRAAFESANSEIAAKYQFLTALVQAEADVAKTVVSEVNQTIRNENERMGKISWWHWRSLIGYLVLLYGFVQIGGIITCMVAITWLGQKQALVQSFIELFNSTALFTTGLFALLGGIAWDNTRLKKAAIEGPEAPQVVARTVNTVRK